MLTLDWVEGMRAGYKYGFVFPGELMLHAKRLRIATDLFRSFPFGEPGYLWEDVEGPSYVIGFDCVRCLVAEFFDRHDESELCVNTWCNLDFPLAEKSGSGHPGLFCQPWIR